MAASGVAEQIADEETLDDLIQQKVEKEVEQRVAEETADIRQELQHEREARRRAERIAKTAVTHAGNNARRTRRQSARLDGMSNRLGNIDDRVYDIERGEVNVSDVIDAGAADSELPVQRWRADVTDTDHPDDASGLTKNQARSTILWKYFPKLSEVSHGKVKLTRGDATKIFRSLSDYDDLPTDNNTVGRAMEFMARGTGPTDDPENEDHLITFQPGDEGSQSVLAADQDEWEAFIADLTGVEAPDRDSNEHALDVPAHAGESGEGAPTADDATEHVVEDSAAIMDAQPVTGASEDSVEEQHGMDDDQPRASEL